MITKLLIVAPFYILLFQPVYGHGGGIDGCGGHNDRKRGGYHVHRYNRYCSCYPTEQGCSKKPTTLLSSTKAVKKKKVTQKKLKIISNRVFPLSPSIFSKYESQIPSVNENSSKNAAKRLQILLKELKYYKGKIDGILGKGSRKAVYSFQRDHNLPQSEIIDARLMRKLDSVISDQNNDTKLDVVSTKITAIKVIPTEQQPAKRIEIKKPDASSNETSSSNSTETQSDEGISINTIFVGIFLGWLFFGRRKRK